MCKRNGNPKRSSRFICLRCMQLNQCGSGIQRGGHQREKYHIKDLMCINPGCKCKTKNIEVRWCDSYEEIYERAVRERVNYYSETENKHDRKVG